MIVGGVKLDERDPRTLTILQTEGRVIKAGQVRKFSPRPRLAPIVK